MSHSKTPWVPFDDHGLYEIDDSDGRGVCGDGSFEDKLDRDLAISAVNAVSRLSPAVRELLLSNPEAVERAVITWYPTYDRFPETPKPRRDEG